MELITFLSVSALDVPVALKRGSLFIIIRSASSYEERVHVNFVQYTPIRYKIMTTGPDSLEAWTPIDSWGCAVVPRCTDAAASSCFFFGTFVCSVWGFIQELLDISYSIRLTITEKYQKRGSCSELLLRLRRNPHKPPLPSMFPHQRTIPDPQNGRVGTTHWG